MSRASTARQGLYRRRRPPRRYRRRRPRRRRSRRLIVYQSALPGLRVHGRTPEDRHATVRWLRDHMMTFLVLLLLGATAYWLFLSDTFYVYGADVQGTLYTTPEEIYALADVDGWNIFWIDPKTVEARIRALAIIKDVDVKLDLPNRLAIRVVERRPVAVWQAGEQRFLVDAEGVLFEVRGDISRAVVVRDLRNASLRPGERVDPEAIVAALELNRLLPEQRVFDWRPGAGLSFVTDEGWRVQVGDHQNLKLKVLIYRQFRAQVAPARNVTFLDLSVPERPYYRVGDGKNQEGEP